MDYLVGFNLSPLLWRKIKPGLSAGRVQSPALRLICEREDEIEKFVAREYWTLEADCDKDGQAFIAAKLHVYQDRQAQAVRHRQRGRCHCRPGGPGSPSPGAGLTVRSVEKKERNRNPVAPVHHLDPAAGGGAQAALFRFKKPCASAQQLYEGVDLGDGPGRPDHLHAHGLRWHSRARPSRNCASSSAKQYGPSTTCQPRPQGIPDQAPRTRRRRTRRSAPHPAGERPGTCARFLSMDQYKLYSPRCGNGPWPARWSTRP